MLSATGILSVEPHKGRIVVNVSNDFVSYYNWFITKKYWVKFATPKYGAHITVANTDRFHKNVNWSKAIHCNNKPITFEYDNYIVRGGQRKGYDVFFVRVYSKELVDLKKKIGIVENAGYQGLHLTISNSKGTLPDYWPDTIKL